MNLNHRKNPAQHQSLLKQSQQWLSEYAAKVRISINYTLIAAMLIICPGISARADCIDPKALWKLDEDTATLIYEDTQNPGNNSGICRQDEGVSVCPQAEEGRYGYGQRFYLNGSRTGIDISANPLFDWQNKENFSIAFWMKRNNARIESNEVIIGRDSKETDNGLHWWIGVDRYGTAKAYFNDRDEHPSYPTMSLSGDTLLTDNKWHYIVFVREGTTSESRLYVDGALEARKKCTHDAPEAFSAPATDINIGWLNLSQGYYYRGALDEIALYDVALPEWFIRDRYHADVRYPAGRNDPCD